MEGPGHLLDPRLAKRIVQLRLKPWPVRCGRFFLLDAEIVSGRTIDPLDRAEHAWLLTDEMRRIGQATKRRWGYSAPR